jgi:hypothetical protein
MINFEKMNLLAGIFLEIKSFQRIPYHLVQVPYIVEFWKRISVLDEKQLHAAVKSINNNDDNHELKFQTTIPKYQGKATPTSPSKVNSKAISRVKSKNKQHTM